VTSDSIGCEICNVGPDSGKERIRIVSNSDVSANDGEGRWSEVGVAKTMLRLPFDVERAEAWLVGDVAGDFGGDSRGGLDDAGCAEDALELCLEAMSCDVVVDEGFAVALAAEVVEPVDVVCFSAFSCRGRLGAVEGKEVFAFEADDEVGVAEAVAGVAAAHVDEWVRHVGREDAWKEVAQI